MGTSMVMSKTSEYWKPLQNGLTVYEVGKLDPFLVSNYVKRSFFYTWSYFHLATIYIQT